MLVWFIQGAFAEGVEKKHKDLRSYFEQTKVTVAPKVGTPTVEAIRQILAKVPPDKITKPYSIRLHDAFGPPEGDRNERAVDRDLDGWTQWQALVYLIDRSRMHFQTTTQQVGKPGEQEEYDVFWVFRYYDSVPFKPTIK